MNHQRASASPRPRFEPVSSALQFPGLWRWITDGNESLCELLSVGSDPEQLETAIAEALKAGWPVILVIQDQSETGYLRYAD